MDRRFEISGYLDFVEEARSSRQQYNLKLEGLLRVYGIASEGELMTGFIENCHEKLGTDRSNVVDMAASVRKSLTRSFRDKFLKVGCSDDGL